MSIQLNFTQEGFLRIFGSTLQTSTSRFFITTNVKPIKLISAGLVPERMNAENILGIIEIIRHSFQTRDFGPMVECFAEDGVYETPYAKENSRSEGIGAIRKRFGQISESAWNKAVKIDHVEVKSTLADDGETAFSEFHIQGKRLGDDIIFDFPSSVAIIRIKGGRISLYRDYPNVAGIREAAGL